jgi:hypothetical protein
MNDERRKLFQLIIWSYIVKWKLVIHTIGSSFDKSSGCRLTAIMFPVVYFLKNQLGAFSFIKEELGIN